MNRIDASSGALAASAPFPGSPDRIWTDFRPLYQLEGRTPERRADAHRANLAIREGDLGRYQAWLERLLDGARAAKTLDALLANGRPAIPPSFWSDPALAAPEASRFESLHADFTRATRDALSELEHLRARLEGRRAPLDVQLEGSAALQVTTPYGRAGVEASLGDHRASAWVARAGGVAEVGLASDGIVDAKRKVVLGLATFTVAGDRLEAEEVSLPGVPVYGRLERETVAVGVAVGRRLGDPKAKVNVTAEAKLGVSLQLLDAETARRAFSPNDEWSTRRK